MSKSNVTSTPRDAAPRTIARTVVRNFFGVTTIAVLLSALACGSATDPGGQQNGQNNGQQNAQTTHPAGTASSRITLDHAGYGIALSANGMVAVTSDVEHSLMLFPLDGSPTAQPAIEVFAFPLDVIFNKAGTTAYVAGAKQLSVIDVASHTVKSAITLTPPITYRLAYPSDESRIYATGGSSRVWSIPLSAGGTPTSVQLTGGLIGLALSPSGKALYAGNFNGTVYRLDPATLATLATGTGAGQFQGDLVVSPDEKQLYAVADNGILEAMDAASLAQIGYTNLGPGLVAMALTPDGTQLYITSVYGSLYIVDRATRTVVKTIALGGTPRYIAFDKRGTTALVANDDGWVDVIK